MSRWGKYALTVAFVWLCSLRHSYMDCGSGERGGGGGDLHNEVYAFHVKCPFKSGLLSVIIEAYRKGS